MILKEIFIGLVLFLYVLLKGETIMKEKLKELQELALSKIEAVKTSSELEEIRVKFLGKKGSLLQY